MQVEGKRIEKCLVMQPTEIGIDSKVGRHFKEKMGEFIESGNIFILLNLPEAVLIDSSGSGSIMSGLKQTRSRGALFICGLKETIMTMFNLTRMDRVFRIFESEQEAIHTSTK